MKTYAGRLIRRSRQARNLSLSRASHWIGTSQANIVQIEAGQRPLPASRLLLFAEVFDINPGMLKAAVIQDYKTKLDVKVARAKRGI